MIKYVSDNPSIIHPPRWTRKSQAEAWVIKRYGWNKTKAKRATFRKLKFVWFNPHIKW